MHSVGSIGATKDLHPCGYSTEQAESAGTSAVDRSKAHERHLAKAVRTRDWFTRKLNAPRALTPVPTSPRQVSAIQVLEQHLHSSLQMPQWVVAGHEAVSALCRGASYAVLPTLPLFPAALVVPALRELERRWNHTNTNIEGRAATPENHAPLWACARPWHGWVTQIIQGVYEREVASQGKRMSYEPRTCWSTRVGRSRVDSNDWHVDNTFLTAAVTCAGEPTQFALKSTPDTTQSGGRYDVQPGDEQTVRRGDTVLFAGVKRQAFAPVTPLVHRRPPQDGNEGRWTHLMFFGDDPREQGYWHFA